MAKWYYSVGGDVLGPMRERDLRDMLASAALRPETPVCREGSQEWMPACCWPQLIRRIRLARFAPEGWASQSAFLHTRMVAVSAFGLLLLAILMAAGNVTAIAFTRHLPGGSLFFNWLVWQACGMFGLYVLGQRRGIGLLPAPYRAMGYIGGIGLVTLLVAAILLLCVPFILA